MPAKWSLMGTGFGEAWTGSDEREYKNARFSQFSAERGEKQECKVFHNYNPPSFC
jgi:hypothetical protein